MLLGDIILQRFQNDQTCPRLSQGFVPVQRDSSAQACSQSCLLSPKNLGQQAPAHLVEAILTDEVGLKREQREIDDFVEPKADFRNTRLLPPAPLFRASPGNPTSFLQQWRLSHSGISSSLLLSDHISGAARRANQTTQEGQAASWHPREDGIWL